MVVSSGWLTSLAVMKVGLRVEWMRMDAEIMTGYEKVDWMVEH